MTNTETNSTSPEERSEVRHLLFHGTQVVASLLIVGFMYTDASSYVNFIIVLFMLLAWLHLFTKEGRSFLVRYADSSTTLLKTLLVTLGVAIGLVVIFALLKGIYLSYLTLGFIGEIVMGVLVLILVLVLPIIIQHAQRR